MSGMTTMEQDTQDEMRQFKEYRNTTTGREQDSGSNDM